MGFGSEGLSRLTLRQASRERQFAAARLLPEEEMACFLGQSRGLDDEMERDRERVEGCRLVGEQ